MTGTESLDALAEQLKGLVSDAQDKVSTETSKTQIRTALITGVTLFAGVLATSAFSFFSADRGHNVEQTRIALALLSGDSEEDALPARKFAVALLLKSTGIKLEQSDIDAWVKSGTIPEFDLKNLGWIQLSPGQNWIDGLSLDKPIGNYQ